MELTTEWAHYIYKHYEKEQIMKKTTHWFAERLQKMSDERKKDIHAAVRLLSELQEIVHDDEDDRTCLYEIVDAIGEIDSGIAERINRYIKRSLELSDIDLWEPWEPATEEEQALMDEGDQIQRGEFV